MLFVGLFFLLPVISALTVPVFWLGCKITNVAIPGAVDSFITLYVSYFIITAYIFGLSLLEPLLSVFPLPYESHSAISYTFITFPSLAITTYIINRFFKFGLNHSAVIALLHLIIVGSFLYFMLLPTH